MHMLIVVVAFIIAAAAPMTIAGAGEEAAADAELLKDWTDDGLDDLGLADVAEARERDEQTAKQA